MEWIITNQAGVQRPSIAGNTQDGISGQTTALATALDAWSPGGGMPTGEAVSLLEVSIGGASVEVRLSELVLAMAIIARSTEPPPDTDNIKPLAEMIISRADMWYYLEVAHHVARLRAEQAAEDGALVLGLVAMAGCGKSTVVQIIRMLLECVLEVGRVQEVALDDFLTSREERECRGIKTRWDINSTNSDIGHAVLKQVKYSSDTSVVKLPVFAKHLDDRAKAPEAKWIKGKCDVVLFEGWRVGVNHPNFFPFNTFVDTLVFVDSDYEAIVGFVKERKKREVAMGGKNEYVIHGGIDFVVENRYYANYLKYLKPLMEDSDIVLVKDSTHHITALRANPGRWQSAKARQQVTDVEAIEAAGLQPSESAPTPVTEPLPNLYLAPNEQVVLTAGWNNTLVLEVQTMKFEKDGMKMEHARWLRTRTIVPPRQ